MTPEEAWSGKQPHLAHMRVFGCICYAKVPDEKRTKLDAKGIKCLFLGYCEGTKAYRVMSMDTKKIIKSPDVAFFEDAEHSKERPSGSDDGPALEGPTLAVDDSIESEDEEDLEVKPKPSVNGPASREPVESTTEDTKEDSEEDKDEEVQRDVAVHPNTRNRGKAKKVVKEVIPPTPPSREDNGTAEESRYSRRVRKPLGQWWMNHIPPRDDEERANMAAIEEPNTMSEAIHSRDASKWEQAPTHGGSIHHGGQIHGGEPIRQGGDLAMATYGGCGVRARRSDHHLVQYGCRCNYEGTWKRPASNDMQGDAVGGIKTLRKVGV